MKVWLNGEIVEDPKVPITCHALHYGTSVFEGIRCYESVDGRLGIFRLKDHVKRFFYSASVLRMKINFSQEDLIKACKEVVKINDLKDCYIRPIAFYNFGRIGLDVRNQNADVAVFAIEFPKYLGEEVVSVKISSYRRIHPNTFKVDAKIGGYYVNSVLATLEAKEFGFDEALLLDYEGNIAEGPGENIFFIKGDKLITPPAISILPGITRDSVIAFARDLGYEVEIRNVHVTELELFDEAFFTGTAAEITPIKRINRIEYSTKKSREIQNYYQKIVRGEIEKYLHWIDFIE